MDQTKLKAFADNKLNVDRVENIVGEGEIACTSKFLLFSQCFQKASFPDLSKGVTVWEWVKCPFLYYHNVFKSGLLQNYVWLQQLYFSSRILSKVGKTSVVYRILSFFYFSGNSSLTAIDFDDVDLSTSPVTKKDAQKQVENGAVVSSMPENPKLNLFQALQESENKDVERNQDDRQESDSKVDGEVAEITDVQGKESCSEKREIDSQSDSNGKQTVMEVDSSSSGSDEPGSNGKNLLICFQL